MSFQLGMYYACSVAILRQYLRTNSIHHKSDGQELVTMLQQYLRTRLNGQRRAVADIDELGEQILSVAGILKNGHIVLGKSSSSTTANIDAQPLPPPTDNTTPILSDPEESSYLSDDLRFNAPSPAPSPPQSARKTRKRSREEPLQVSKHKRAKTSQ